MDPKPPRPSAPRLTPLVPPRPREPANRALEEGQRRIRTTSSPDVEELEVEVKASFEGLALHLAREHRINRARDRLLVMLARAHGLGDIIPFELHDSRPPPPLERPQPLQLLPRIGRDVERIQQEIHVSRTEKLFIIATNALLALPIIIGAVMGKIDVPTMGLMLGLVAFPGAGSLAFNALKDRNAKKEQP
jgi:hypothetical protein